jgi:hypothetical protein
MTERSRFTLEHTPWSAVAGRWAEFHARSGAVDPFASRAWLETLSRAAGLAVDAWVVKKGDEWIAALAVPHRPWFGRRIAAGLPLAAYSPLVTRPPANGHPASRTTEHLDATSQIARELPRAYELIDLLLPAEFDDVRGWTWNGWSARPRYTYVLSLTTELRLADSVRRHLRKCREAGYEVDLNWSFDAFWDPFEATRRRQGFTTRLERSTLASAANDLHAAGEAWMVGIRAPDGRWVASQILVGGASSPTTGMWLAGSHDDALASGASSFLMVASAEEARRRGHRAWDLCGADLPGVARFKAELGADLRSYFQVSGPRSPLGSLLRFAGGAARALRGA